jgi:galactokinase
VPPDEAARADEFRALWSQEPTPAVRQKLGDLMFASHRARSAAGLGNATADLVVDAAWKRRDAGGAVLGARLSGRGGGGTVVLLGQHGKVWYEALRVKKVLLEATGHSGHVFRWSSPGALAFGVIELEPSNGA